MLVAKIFMGKELDDSVVKSYFTTAADGKKVQCHLLCLGNDSCRRVSGPGRSRDSVPAMGQCAFERVSCKGIYDIRRKEEARLADEADMEELRRIEDEAKRRGKDGERR